MQVKIQQLVRIRNKSPKRDVYWNLYETVAHIYYQLRFLNKTNNNNNNNMQWIELKDFVQSGSELHSLMWRSFRCTSPFSGNLCYNNSPPNVYLVLFCKSKEECVKIDIWPLNAVVNVDKTPIVNKGREEVHKTVPLVLLVPHYVFPSSITSYN